MVSQVRLLRTYIPFRGILGAGLMMALLGSCAHKSPATTDARPILGAAALSRLDLLPKLKPSVKVGCVSSYDRTGGNDDGFSGKYSFLRKEPGGLVIADLQGPGIITRIHLPSPTDEFIEFYFDGESTPRISRKIPELFDGNHPPFLAPLVGSGVGGHYCYVPIAYQKSCKILVKTETFHFYQVNYAQYPPDFVIPSYEDPPSESFLRELEKAGRLLEKTGTDIASSLVPEGTPLKTRTSHISLGPGQSATVFETSNPGRIVGLKFSPAEALAGKDRGIILKMFWDGSEDPAVDAPAGDFFGASFGDPAVRSLLLGTSESTDYAYFPMPFAHSARIELSSERISGPPLEIRAEVTFAALGKAADEGRFYARWRRENPTRDGVPFTYLKTTGKGHIVGVILQAQGIEPGHTAFFEGDDRAVIDGKLAIPGTGSEDSFNGGWYDVPGRWERRASYPLSGCLDYKKPLGRTGGYRWFITDTYPYAKSIEFTIEHGPEGNKVPTDYASLTFFYSADPPPADAPLPAVSERGVSDPERIVFVPGWNVPIHTFSIENATLTKRVEKINGAGVRFISMRTHGEDIFGPHHISFVCDLPSAGKYRVGIKTVQGPDQGIVRVFRNDVPAGSPVDLYEKVRGVSQVLPLGTFDMNSGENIIYLHLVGKNQRSTGLGMDIAEIVFEKIH